jgi:ABC-2 type transport system ATP-binding protein
VISSHVLTDIERTCDWVIMLDGGKVLRSGPLTDLSTTDEVELEVIGDPTAVTAAAERLGATVELVGSVLHLTSADRDAFEIACDALNEARVPLRRLAAKRTTLEDVFMGEGSNG